MDFRRCRPGIEVTGQRLSSLPLSGKFHSSYGQPRERIPMMTTLRAFPRINPGRES